MARSGILKNEKERALRSSISRKTTGLSVVLFAAVMLCVPLRAAGQAAFEGIVPVELLAADGVRVAAELYPALAGERAVALLFHQAGSNAAEYAPIAGRLRRLGITCLAIDQRSGGRMWGRQNRTVARLGASATFWEAYADLEAALSWAATHHPGKPLLAWGSSYTAALVLRLAAEHPGELTAVFSFSPGEYFGPGEPVRAWAERVRQPLFVTSAPGSEVAVAKRIFEAAPARLKRQFVPASGVHGASILREDRNPGATGPVWAAVEKFLAEVLGAAPAASSSGPPRNARGEHGCASE